MAGNLQIVFSTPGDSVSDEEFDAWYEEHLDEILSIPGFHSAQRYALQPAVTHPDVPMPWRRLVVYEVDSDTAALMKAMEEMNRETLRRVALHRADAVVTTFHQCYREICGLEAHANTRAYNYIHLFAQSIGLDYVDEYKAWKKAGPEAAQLIGEQRLAQVGVAFFERAMLPELVKRPLGIDRPKSDGKS